MSTRLTWLVMLMAAVAAMSVIAPARALATPQYVGAAQDPDGNPADYWSVTPTGVVVAHGAAPNDGSVTTPLNQPVVGMAAPPGGQGYWLVAGDGGVFRFGNVGFFGSMGGKQLTKPIVGMASTADGQGYWLVGADGGIFAFGDAGFYGTTANETLNAPIVGMAATPDGKGYWLVGADGGVFPFGDAPFYGSMGNRTITAPIVGIEGTPNGQGYWLVGSDGDVYSFGDAGSYGSELGQTLPEPVIGMASSSDGAGYRLFDGNGGVYDFGDFDTGPATSPTAPTTAPPSTGTSPSPVPLPSKHHGHHTVRVRAALSWHWSGPVTRLSEVKVLHVPGHLRMTTSCTGHGCPRGAGKRTVSGARPIRRHLLALRGTRFHEGDLWHVSFTRRGWRSQRLLFTFRHGRPPLVAVVRPTKHHRHTHHRG